MRRSQEKGTPIGANLLFAKEVKHAVFQNEIPSLAPENVTLQAPFLQLLGWDLLRRRLQSAEL